MGLQRLLTTFTSNLTIPLHQPFILLFLDMSVPRLIDGVLVHRNFIYKHPKFRFYRYPFPSTALRLGSYSPDIPEIRPLLRFGIRILYIHAPSFTETNKQINLDFPSFFFGYWSGNVRQSHRTTHMVFFRDDLQPLHPKQARVLWEFCDRLVLDVYSAVEFAYPWVMFEDEGADRGKVFDEVVSRIAGFWMEQCTVDNFNAFFNLFRNSKLLRGREGWRKVRPPNNF